MSNDNTPYPTIAPDAHIDKSGDFTVKPIEDPRKYSSLDPRRIPCLRQSLMSGIARGLGFAILRKLWRRM